MIQGITSLPHKWDSFYAGSGYAFSNPETPSEIHVSRLDGNSPNPRPSSQEKRPGKIIKILNHILKTNKLIICAMDL